MPGLLGPVINDTPDDTCPKEVREIDTQVLKIAHEPLQQSFGNAVLCRTRQP